MAVTRERHSFLRPMECRNVNDAPTLTCLILKYPLVMLVKSRNDMYNCFTMSFKLAYLYMYINMGHLNSTNL